MYKLAVLNSHPIQYFAPLYAHLARDPLIDLTVFYCTDASLRGAYDSGFKRNVAWDVDLLDGYRSVFLGEGSRTREAKGFFSLVCPEIWREIRSGRFDAVVLHGYNYAVNWLAFIAAKSHGSRIFMRSETHLALRRFKWKTRLRDSFLARAYRCVDGFFTIGAANRTYYRELGVRDARLFHVPYSVDNKRFIESALLASGKRDEWRNELGIDPNTIVVLFASKFLRRKRPSDVMHAVGRLRAAGYPVTLLLVGTGAMEADLAQLAKTLPTGSAVFGGFMNQTELPKAFAASDVFVLPSEDEPWGLVVNEAMCAALPIVVADEVGCAADLVKEGVNGFRFETGNVDSLTKALESVVADAETRARMGSASRSIIRGWGYEECRLGIIAALESTSGTRRSKGE